MVAQRIIFALVVLATIMGALYFLRSEESSRNTLHVCTWSNYFPDNLLDEFSRQTVVPVELSYVSSNEELSAKLKAGATGFDVILPSDYMVRQMSALNMLRGLDHAAIPNLSYLEPFYQDLPYDEGNRVSIPFTWGTTGIAINTDKVKIPTERVSWDVLFNSPDPRRTSLLDDMRE